MAKTPANPLFFLFEIWNRFCLCKDLNFLEVKPVDSITESVKNIIILIVNHNIHHIITDMESLCHEGK